jgi:hypothetical protein
MQIMYLAFGAFCGLAIGGQIGKLVHVASGSFSAGLVACAACVVCGIWAAASLFKE